MVVIFSFETYILGPFFLKRLKISIHLNFLRDQLREVVIQLYREDDSRNAVAHKDLLNSVKSAFKTVQ